MKEKRQRFCCSWYKVTLYTILFTYASCVTHLCFTSFFLTVFCQKHKYAISLSNLWLLRLACTIYSEPISFFLSQVLQLSILTKIIVLQCIVLYCIVIVLLLYCYCYCIVTVLLLYCYCIALPCKVLYCVVIVLLLLLYCYCIVIVLLLYC